MHFIVLGILFGIGLLLAPIVLRLAIPVIIFGLSWRFWRWPVGAIALILFLVILNSFPTQPEPWKPHAQTVGQTLKPNPDQMQWLQPAPPKPGSFDWRLAQLPTVRDDGTVEPPKVSQQDAFSGLLSGLIRQLPQEAGLPLCKSKFDDLAASGSCRRLVPPAPAQVSYQAPPGQHCSRLFAGLASNIPCDPVPDAAAPSAEVFWYRYGNVKIGPFLTRQKAVENCLSREKDIRRSLACDESTWAEGMTPPPDRASVAERTSADGPYKKALEELLKTPALTPLGN